MYVFISGRFVLTFCSLILSVNFYHSFNSYHFVAVLNFQFWRKYRWCFICLYYFDNWSILSYYFFIYRNNDYNILIIWKFCSLQFKFNFFFLYNQTKQRFYFLDRGSTLKTVGKLFLCIWLYRRVIFSYFICNQGNNRYQNIMVNFIILVKLIKKE